MSDVFLLILDIKDMDGAGKRLQNFYGISPTTVRRWGLTTH